MSTENAFLAFDLRSAGKLYEHGDLSVHALSREPLVVNEGSSCWVLVTEGEAIATLDGSSGSDRFSLRAEHYLTAPGPASIAGGAGLAIVLANYRSVRQLGGPLEPAGRLRYVDGCSDTLLVCPPRLGEPCLNHLHIPAQTDQSEHTHPSLRVGVIARGRGVCRTPAGDVPLTQGLGWLIPSGLRHSFITREQALDVFAWHPDSDFGPTDEDHPMINRTLLSHSKKIASTP
jgi:hypothetical protein